MSSCEGTENPGKLSYWEILEDFSSGWKEFCTLAGNQCFLILIRPVATSATDIPTPGRASFKVPIIAAILLLRNPGIPHADEVPLVLLVLSSIRMSHDGQLPMFRFVADSLNYINLEKKLATVYRVLLWGSCCVLNLFGVSSICTCAEMLNSDLHCQSPRTAQQTYPLLCILAQHVWYHWEIFIYTWSAEKVIDQFWKLFEQECSCVHTRACHKGILIRDWILTQES